MEAIGLLPLRKSAFLDSKQPPIIKKTYYLILPCNELTSLISDARLELVSCNIKPNIW